MWVPKHDPHRDRVIDMIASRHLVRVRMDPGPQKNIRLWLEPWPLMTVLIEADHQIVHNDVLERVLDAIVQRCPICRGRSHVRVDRHSASPIPWVWQEAWLWTLSSTARDRYPS